MLLAVLLSASIARPAVSAARPVVPKTVLALRGGFNPVTALPRAYGSALATSPLATNIVTAAGLAVAADLFLLALKPAALEPLSADEESKAKAAVLEREGSAMRKAAMTRLTPSITL